METMSSNAISRKKFWYFDSKPEPVRADAHGLYMRRHIYIYYSILQLLLLVLSLC